jgi:hypothetical protein
MKNAYPYTNEMRLWFTKRTDRHIKLVQKYCDMFSTEIGKGLIATAKGHDQSKFEHPEYIPYIHSTWLLYKPSTNHKISSELKKAIYEAKLHHIILNPHHPEYWSDDQTDLLNSIDYNKPTRLIDASRMPMLYVAEMVADWCAIAEELDNDMQSWAKSNIGVRWEFSVSQRSIIRDLIEMAKSSQA